MIDTKLLRESPDDLRHSLQRRGVELDVDLLVRLDAAHRDALREAEELRAQQNAAGKRIATLDGEEKEKAIAEVSELADRQKDASARADELGDELFALLLEVPNLVAEDAADGFTEEDADEIKRFGEPTPGGKDHASLGAALDIIDTERAAKVSGSRFGYLKGRGAMLELALVRWAMDHLVEAGLTPMIPPVLVREHALEGTGFFPEARDQVYEIPKDELYLVGTSEVSLAAYHGDEILDRESLPLRYAGFSTCFRREAGTYGKDTSGIFRVHQFDKVEMFVFTTPDESPAEHEHLLQIEESLISQLEIPYRVVNVAAGDLGAAASKKYDIEAWFPGEENYREITSCSNTTDYQARRLKIRYRAESGNVIAHTLNGTACAVGRTILAILENHQQPDGSVVIPEALRRYTGFEAIEP